MFSEYVKKELFETYSEIIVAIWTMCLAKSIDLDLIKLLTHTLVLLRPLPMMNWPISNCSIMKLALLFVWSAQYIIRRDEVM